MLESVFAHASCAGFTPAARSLVTGEWALVRSARGAMRARACVTPTVAPGQVFVPMHDVTTNRLTNPSFDPYSRQPSYKSAAVQVTRDR